MKEYMDLLRAYPSFRWYWISMIVSLLGDWFNTVAIYDLVGSQTGSPLALAGVLVVKMLPFAVFSPLGGLIADRFNRRNLMMGMDLLRAVLVFGMIFAQTPERLGLLYVLSMLQVVLGAVFIPASRALLPNLLPQEKLLTANTITSATWSSLLAIGAALGGFATAMLGKTAAFAIDSASYMISAYCLWKVYAVSPPIKPSTEGWVKTAYKGILDGWRLMRTMPEVGRMAWAKAIWSLGGGGLVFALTLLGAKQFPHAPAIGIGLLYSVRGFGTGIGPILAKRFFQDTRRWAKVMGWAVFASGLCYSPVGALGGCVGLMMILIFIAHAASGANWVLSTVLLQQRTPDEFRGRIFSTDWLLVTLVESVSIITAGFLLESQILSLGMVFASFALIQMICGIGWVLTLRPVHAARS